MTPNLAKNAVGTDRTHPVFKQVFAAFIPLRAEQPDRAMGKLLDNPDARAAESLRESLGIIDESAPTFAKLASDQSVDGLIADLSDLALSFEDACEKLDEMVPDGMSVTFQRHWSRYSVGAAQHRFYVCVMTDPDNPRAMPDSTFTDTPAEAVAFVAHTLRAFAGGAA